MTTRRFRVGALEIALATAPQATRTAYMLYPMAQADGWAAMAARKYGIDFAVITGMDWDNDLTPWPAPGQPPGSPDFTGAAPRFLDVLRSGVIPAVEAHAGSDKARDIIGVSLSGLFAMWQWSLYDLFDNLGCISGSFWYPRFAQWFDSRRFSKTGKACLLLGDREAETSVVAFRSVAVDTAVVVKHLRSLYVDTTFHSVPGNHYQHPQARLDLTLSTLYPQI